MPTRLRISRPTAGTGTWPDGGDAFLFQLLPFGKLQSVKLLILDFFLSSETGFLVSIGFPRSRSRTAPLLDCRAGLRPPPAFPGESPEPLSAVPGKVPEGVACRHSAEDVNLVVRAHLHGVEVRNPDEAGVPQRVWIETFVGHALRAAPEEFPVHRVPHGQDDVLSAVPSVQDEQDIPYPRFGGLSVGELSQEPLVIVGKVLVEMDSAL